MGSNVFIGKNGVYALHVIDIHVPEINDESLMELYLFVVNLNSMARKLGYEIESADGERVDSTTIYSAYYSRPQMVLDKELKSTNLLNIYLTNKDNLLWKRNQPCDRFRVEIDESDYYSYADAIDKISWILE